MKKRNIYLMYAIALLQGMVFYGPIATLYRQANGVSIFQITLIESISYILCILFEVPWGMAADRIGYKKTMVFCCGLYFVSKLVFWQAEGFGGFLLERILLAVVIAGFTGVDSSILYLSCGEGESHRVFGIYNSLSTVGMLGASFVYSVAVGDHYRTAALLTVLSYGLAAVLSCFLSEVKGADTGRFCFREFREILVRILGNKPLLLFLTAVAFLTQTGQTIVVFLNQLQYQQCGMSSSAIGIVFLLATLVETLGVFSERITRKVGVKHAGIVFYGEAVLACLALCFTGSAFVSVCGILLLNLSGSLFRPLQTEAQNRQVVSTNRATELSIYAILIDLLCAGISVAFGAFARIRLEAAFFFGAVLSAAGLVLFRVWFYCHEKSEKHP